MANYKLQYEKAVTFVIPLASGDYAPERHKIDAASESALVATLRGVLEAAVPAGAIIEIWVLKVGGNPAVDADFIFAANFLSGATITTSTNVYVPHLQLRAKSGGTAGNATLHVTAI